MKYTAIFSLFTILLLHNNCFIHGKKIDDVISTSMEVSSSRRLSIWSSLLHLLECPPGPLGAHCKTDNNNHSSSSSHSDSSHHSGSRNRSSSSSSKQWWNRSNDDNDNSNDDNDDDNKINNHNDDDRNSWTSWFNGGSGINEGSYNDDEKEIGGANAAENNAFPWFLMILAIGGVVTGGGYATYQSSLNEQGVASFKTLGDNIKGIFVKKGNESSNEYKLAKDGSALA